MIIVRRQREHVMKKVTIYRDDMNNPLHGNLFNSLLEDLGIATHKLIDGRYVDMGVDEITLTVAGTDVEEI